MKKVSIFLVPDPTWAGFRAVKLEDVQTDEILESIHSIKFKWLGWKI